MKTQINLKPALINEVQMEFGPMFMGFIFSNPSVIQRSYANMSVREIKQLKKMFRQYAEQKIANISTEGFMAMIESAKIMRPKKTRKSSELAVRSHHTTRITHSEKKHAPVITEPTVRPVAMVESRAKYTQPGGKRPQSEFIDLLTFSSLEEIPEHINKDNIFICRTTKPHRAEIDKSFPILYIEVPTYIMDRGTRESIVMARHAYIKYVRDHMETYKFAIDEHNSAYSRPWGTHVATKRLLKGRRTKIA